MSQQAPVSGNQVQNEHEKLPELSSKQGHCLDYPSPQLDGARLRNPSLKALWDSFLELLKALESDIAFWDSWLAEEHTDDLKRFYSALTVSEDNPALAHPSGVDFNLPAGGPGVSVAQLTDMARRYEILSSPEYESIIPDSELQLKLKAYIEATKKMTEDRQSAPAIPSKSWTTGIVDEDDDMDG